MKHMATYLMLKLGNDNADVTPEQITAALAKVGIESDPEALKRLMEELDGKDLGELMEAGKGMLAKFGGGGGGGGGAAPVAEAKAAVKEEVVEEEVDMGGSMDMFGGEAGGGDY